MSCLLIAALFLYPQPAGEARNAAGYAVQVNGQPAGVAAVRCSAMPVNIRWPGHQRELDQTEICGMVRFSTDEKVTLSVTPPRDFKTVKVRPYSKKVTPKVSGRTATFEIPGPGYYTVEFDGRHENLHIFADPPEKLRVAPNEKGVRYFGPGEHDAGVITMKSDETVYIDAGAVVYGRIIAKDADHIRILGRGILDMSRILAQPKPIDPKLAAEQKAKGFAITNVRRWDAIRLTYCDDVLIDGITIRDSLCYNIRPIACRGLTIRNAKLIGNWRYNSDGIDMHNCENVRVTDCFVRTFDDSICVKGFDYTMNSDDMVHDGYNHNVFTNVVISGCTIWTDWGRSLEFGAETQAKEIRDVIWRDCDVINVEAVPLDILNVDNADIHDVLFENIRVEMDELIPAACFSASAKAYKATERKQPNLFRAAIIRSAEYSKKGGERGRIRDITLRDITVTAPKLPHVTMYGWDAEHRTTGVKASGIYWNGRDVTDEVIKTQHAGAHTEPMTRWGR